MSTQSTSLAGEFFVLAQLSMKGCIGTLTLGNTKNVDILCTNPNTGKLFKVEVKTTSKHLVRSHQFGNNYEWIMDKKHEELLDKSLVYVFVLIMGQTEMPLFFIVSSKDVADYVRKEHVDWLKMDHKKEIKSGKMRTFRIGVDANSHGLKQEKYQNNWTLFDEGIYDCKNS